LEVDVHGLAARALSLASSHDVPLRFLLRESLGRHFRERAAIAIERGFFARERLPTLDDDVCELRVEFHAEANALRHLGCGKRGAATEERIVNEIAAFDVIQNRAAHQLNWFLGWMIQLLFI